MFMLTKTNICSNFLRWNAG